MPEVINRIQRESPESQPSRSEQDYLKAIHRLGGCSGVVSPMKIANLLMVRPPSVTTMLRNLGKAGWIKYQPGVGARLTKRGLLAARRVIRRHRLVELFLTRALGLDWSEVDAEAEELEHVMSSRLEQAVATYLGEPMEDPHGHPIPTAEGKLQQRRLQPLSTFCQGQRILIREVADDDPACLRRWQALGLTPGGTVEILKHQPVDDIFELQIQSKTVTMGRAGLAGLWGEAVEDSAKKEVA